MDFTIKNNVITLCYYSPQLRSKVSRVKAKAPPGVTSEMLVLIAQVLINLCVGLSLATFQEYGRKLAAIFQYFIVHGRSWPRPEEWPAEIFNLYCYQLEGFVLSRSVDSSREIWGRMSLVLNALMGGGVIPRCPLPSANLPPNSRKELAESLPLGEAYESLDPLAFVKGEVLPKQYLIDLSYLQDSEDFFEKIEAELDRVSRATFGLCWKYWQEIKLGHAVGRELIGSISRIELMAAINNPANVCWPRQGKVHPADPESPHGIAYFLAAVNYFFFEERKIGSVSLDALRAIPFFQPICRSQRKRKLLFNSLRKLFKAGYLYGPDLIARGIGLLSSRDCSVIAAILIHEQPRFNPGSLETASAYDKNGKLQVSLTDAGGEHVLFTVGKSRAKSRKGGVLTKLASEVLVDVHKMTSRLRLRMLNEQPDVAGVLFLVVTKAGMGHVGRLTDNFCVKNYSFFNVYQADIEAAGMGRGTFSLMKIRNTKGILVWLRTGALITMAEAMGNQVKTILNNYIPDWLYHRMLTSTARRLHQKIIILATAGEKWQLQVSDFSTIEQLENFIIKTLASNHKGNLLSDLFYRKFSKYAGAATAASYEATSNDFYVLLSPESIAALEIYVRFSSKAPFMVRKHGSSKVLDYSQLAKLYQLIYSAVHADPSDDSESFVLDLVSSGSHALLKDAWRKSRSLVKKFEKFAAGNGD